VNATLIIGLILGLSSSLHCIGMCGPIAMVLPLKDRSAFGVFSGVMQYNIGRIFVYSLLGSIIGAIGFTASLFGTLQVVSIITGIAMIVFAWQKHLFSGFTAWNSYNGFLSKGIGTILGSDSTFKLFLLGALNGLLPCGMIFIALMNAVTAGNPINGASAMIAFGLGTLPAMMIVGIAASKMNRSLQQRINTLVPYVLTIVGLLVVLRGMNLNIPYISPSIKRIKKTEAVKECTKPNPHQEVHMQCCHSK
jgi:sulfite exporter TauE/SafE